MSVRTSHAATYENMTQEADDGIDRNKPIHDGGNATLVLEYPANHSLWIFSIFRAQTAHGLFSVINIQNNSTKNLPPDISNAHFVKIFHEYLTERDDIITVIKLLGISTKRTAGRKIAFLKSTQDNRNNI